MMVGERQNTVTNPEFEVVEKSRHITFIYNTYSKPFFERNWHYHPEYELLLITKGFGRRFVGDHSEDFEEGDLVLLGSYLPHAWISDSAFINESSNEICESAYIQFDGKIFDSLFFELPEFAGVKNIAKKAVRGLKLVQDTKEKVTDIILSFPKLNKFERGLEMLRAFNIIHKGKYQYLASKAYISGQIGFKSQRMRIIHQFVMQNFKEDISVDMCAELLNMTKSSFCRYFKKQTNLTFTNYLKMIRVDFAKKLLLNTDMAIKEVGFECGFESISYFNQVFKHYTGTTPKQVQARRV